MSTDIKKNDKRDYVEKVMSMTDARFLSEAESFRFEKRRTPVSTWIAAACFALFVIAAALLLIKPLRERPVVIPANSSEPTASPTEQASETPTPAPTSLPTKPIPNPAPADWDCDPYCMEQWDGLYGYFIFADENGITNGEKCFINFDPTMTAFWGTERGSDTGSWLTWKAIGTDMPDELYLTDIYLAGTEDAPLQLSYWGFSYNGDPLKSLVCENIVFNQFYVSYDSNLEQVYGIRAVNSAILRGNHILDRFDISSETHCRYEVDSELYDPAFFGAVDEQIAFTVDLTSDGDGSVGVFGGKEEDNSPYTVTIYAAPKEGHSFIGWFDAEGSLISTEGTLDVSYIDENGAGVHDFTGIARFAPSDEPPLAEYHARLTFVNGLGEELNDLNFFIGGDNSDVTAYGLSETVTKFDINEYSLDKLSIVACVSEKHQDGAYITHKHILPYFKYKHGDVIELKKNGETAFATVTRSGGSYELPVISYEYVSGHLLSMSEELLHPVVADTSGKCSEFGTDYDDRIYIGTEYGSVTLNESEAAKYPSLARVLEARNARIETELAEAHDRMLADTSKYRTQELFRSVSAIRRADSMVLSFIGCESIEHNDELHSRIYSSENYETATGRLLTLSDIVTDASALASILNAKLEEGDAAFRFDPAKHFGAPSEDFAWTIDHDGLFFIINGDFSSLFVPFSEHEGLVKAEYLPVSENYMVQLVDSVENWFTVNGKAESTATYAQQLEAVKAGLDDDGNPLAFIHAGGRDYLLIDGQRYIWGESSNLLLFGNGFACRMYNGFDWIFRGFKTENLGSGNYINALLANGCNTDPCSITAMTDVMAIGYHWGAAAKFALNDDGRFVRTDDYFEADFERTLLKEYTVDEIDLDGNTIGTITIGAGETVRVFRFNYGFEDARTADGRIVRLTLPENSENYTNYEESMAIFGNLDFGP